MYDLLKREDINWRTLNLTIGAKLYNSHKLYHRAVRKQWTQASDLPWKAVEMVVAIDSSTHTGVNAKPNYQSVKLLFVRGINDKEDRTTH